MPDVYDESWILAPGARVGAAEDLDSAESTHLARVLRLREGVRCTATDGRGSVLRAVLASADPRRCRLEFEELVRQEPRPPRSLAQAILKNRGIEDVLDLCAQTPLRSFQPLWTRHVQVPRGRDIEHQMERLRAKAAAALQQSKQAWLCEILPPMDFAPWLDSADRPVALCEVGGTADRAPDEAWIAIGPEGGFAPEEIDRARAGGARILSLGTSRLRATAAGLWALARA